MLKYCILHCGLTQYHMISYDTTLYHSIRQFHTTCQYATIKYNFVQMIQYNIVNMALYHMILWSL